jgi:hypothetical protein
LDDAKDISDIAKIYELDKIKDHEWHIQVKFIDKIGLFS